MRRSLILALTGLSFSLAAGAAVGHFLHDTAKTPADPDEPKASAFVKLPNQFVVPILRQDKVASLVVLSLALEVSQDASTEIYDREPKLRDRFLQLMFTHAQSGGFTGDFTEAASLQSLRNALRETAQKEIGPEVTNVLITEIGRQDN